MKVDIINLSDIEFGNRKREEYGDIDELSHSIKVKGMITPMAVQTTPNNNKPYLLVAGGRRYKAAELIGLKQVPVRVYEGELTELDFREIELFENIHRKDLEWKERVRQEREIHLLQIEKYGEKISTSPDAKGHTLKDTGQMLGMSGEHVRQSIIIANTMDKFPQLFEGIKTKADASKIVKAISEKVIKDEIVKRVEEHKKVNPNKNNLSDFFILESFFHGVERIPKGSINLVEIDPPYAIDLLNAKKTKHRNRNINYGDSYNEIDIESYPNFIKKTLKLCYEVMTDHSWLIMWFAPEPWFEYMYSWIIEAGFTTRRICGIWKKHIGQNNRPELYLSNSYEMFFYAKKGTPVIAKPHGSIFDFPPIPPQRKVHPTERPIELTNEIYSTFAFPGANILIPFLGSGNGLISANQLNMNAIGFELSKEFRDSFIVRTHNIS